jgi:hypothetical protein
MLREIDPMNDPKLTVAAVRQAVERLITRGQLTDPQQLRLSEPHLVLDIDDHVSDEAIAGGRLRVVLRSSRELYALARALDEAAAEVERREME